MVSHSLYLTPWLLLHLWCKVQAFALFGSPVISAYLLKDLLRTCKERAEKSGLQKQSIRMTKVHINTTRATLRLLKKC